MKVDDILGLGKILPIDKLFEIVSNSVGKISKPYFDKRDIDTKAYEIKKLAEARAEEMKIMTEAVKENYKSTGGISYKENVVSIESPKIESEQLSPVLEDRIQDRIKFQEARRQHNIENITGFAAEDLKNEKEEIPNEPIDEDWATKFFRIAEDISSEEMQALWGKILAGEIKQPKSFSLRTLDLIRNLSKDEADLFVKVANLAINGNGSNLIFKGSHDNSLDKYGIRYSDIARLTELGLLQTGDFVQFQIRNNSQDSQQVFTAGNIVMIIKIKANTSTIDIPVTVFSTVGNQLLKLIKTNPPSDYLKSLAEYVKRENVEPKYAYIIGYKGTNIQHTLPLQDFK